MPLPLPSSPRASVRLRGARVDFAGRRALADLDLDVDSGALTVIAGPNGAGKTTLLEVIAGTRALSAGSRTVTGTIAFVPQRTAVSDRLPVTVRDVVTVGSWGRAGRWRRLDSACRASIEDALDRMEIRHLAAEPFGELSGGQRQRALLAQGLARRADLLLLDEPTTGLDLASSERIRETMRAETARGVTVLCVSHDTAVLTDADRIVRLQDGVVVTDAMPAPSSRAVPQSR